MSIMGDSFFLISFGKAYVNARRIAVIKAAFMSKAVLSKQCATSIYMPVAKIMPIIAGFMPLSAACTYLLETNFFITETMSRNTPVPSSLDSIISLRGKNDAEKFFFFR